MDDSATTSLRGFGAVGIAAIVIVLLSGNIVLPNLIVVPAGALLVLAWTSLSRTPLSDIGYVRPRSWPLSIAIAVAGGIALKLLMKSLVMPLLGAEPVNHAYHFLAGNRAMLPNAILAMCVVGFSEETVFRGFFFERLHKLFGSSVAARTAIVALTSLLFGLGHYQTQGLAGTEQALFTGLVFGSAFAVTRSLYPVMIAHAAFDLTALAIIYCDAESSVAHALLR